MEIAQITGRLKHLLTRNKPNIFFLHIPKTGGTSTIHALRKNYPFSFFKIHAGSSFRAAQRKHGREYQNFDQCYDLRESVAAYAMEAGYKCIAGHIPYSSNLFEKSDNNFLLMTILRDPVQRFISKYMYNYHKSSEHFKYEMSFSDYLDSEMGRSSGREYLRYLSGESLRETELSESELLQRSKETIDKIEMVGFLEDLESFTALFQKQTGIKLRIPHKNRTKDLVQEQSFSEETKKRIQEICKFDIEIYNYARKCSQK